jgi:hypothetical protein
MIMGGFHHFQGSDKAGDQYNAVHPLTYKNVVSILRNKTLSLPTEKELQNQSKSDGLAKTLVFLQALWFVAQCIARRVEKLPTTELEIVTLAYTTIYVGIFIAWWDKPRNVECPIRVFHAPVEADNAEQVEGWLEDVLNVIVGRQDVTVNLHSSKKVPIFYSGKAGEEVIIADMIILAAGVVFGAIHCVAWSFPFLSHAEAFLWRLSSVAITAIPVLLVVTLFLGILAGYLLEFFASEPWGDRAGKFIFSFTPLYGLLYVAARLTTVVLALINLSSLPPGAFRAVHWTTLLPHL